MQRFENGPSRRKKGTGKSKDSPFPIPISSISRSFPCHGLFMHYTGTLVGDRVVVSCTGDMAFLYRMGFFGKGTLSRSQPDFYQRQTNAHVPETSNTPSVRLRIMKKRQYLRHKRWQKEKGLNSETMNKEDHVDLSSDDISSEEEFEEGGQTENSGQNIERDKAGITTSNSNVNWNSNTDTSSCDKSRDHIDGVTRTAVKDETGDKLAASQAAWDPSNSELAGRASSENKTQEKDAEEWKADDSFWLDEDDDDDDDKGSNADKFNNDTISVIASKTELGVGNDNSTDTLTEAYADRTFDTGNVKVEVDNNVCSPERGKHTSERQSSVERTTFTVSESQHMLDVYESEEMDISEDTHSLQYNDRDRDRSELSSQAVMNNCGAIDGSREATHSKAVEVTHPECTEEVDGDLLVIDDSEDEDRRGLKRKKQQLFWPAVRKREPFKVSENLCLSLEEAFFLSYGLGCLSVINEEKKLSLCEMWQLFCQKEPHFIHRYVAYHFFRSKGWVPKSGLKFGVDFILYREGPPFFHGSYSVVVNSVREPVEGRGDGNMQDGEPVQEMGRTFNWTKLAGLNRITEHVAKVLMFCNVIVPPSLTVEDKTTPTCIPKYKVQLHVMQRWVASQERDKELETDVL